MSWFRRFRIPILVVTGAVVLGVALVSVGDRVGQFMVTMGLVVGLFLGMFSVLSRGGGR